MKTEKMSLYELGQEYEKHIELQQFFIDKCKADIQKAKMLGDRDAYGKEMLHYTDTFTKEGTVLNKFDFYDSDGKRKSVFGTAMRTASQILPMFLHPAVGYTWGALNAAKGIGQSMAALSKGIDSIITGEDDNEFGRTMTKMENWLARFDNSKSA